MLSEPLVCRMDRRHPRLSSSSTFALLPNQLAISCPRSRPALRLPKTRSNHSSDLSVSNAHLVSLIRPSEHPQEVGEKSGRAEGRVSRAHPTHPLPPSFAPSPLQPSRRLPICLSRLQSTRPSTTPPCVSHPPSLELRAALPRLARPQPPRSESRPCSTDGTQPTSPASTEPRQSRSV